MFSVSTAKNLWLLAAFLLMLSAFGAPQESSSDHISPMKFDEENESSTLVVDTDGGGDDALAILALLGAERLGSRTRVHAVTCVNGNTGVRNVTRNVLATLELAGRLDVPVYRGASESLVTTARTDSFYGHDGFGDFLPTNRSFGGSQQLRPEPAAVALTRMVAERPGRVTLVCLGPLTNIALASRIDPSFLGNLADLFILGSSARSFGNTKAATEFNVYIDPEAFQAVLNSVAKPAFVVPWETMLALNTSVAWRESVLGQVQSPQVEFLNRAERVALNKKKSLWSFADGLVAMSVLQPDVMGTRTTTRMDVVLGDGSARAATLVDFGNKSQLPRNVVLLENADKAVVQTLLQQLLSAPVPLKYVPPSL